MSMGVLSPSQRCTLFIKVYGWCGIHIGVGFCVARSTEMGNARASVRGTGDCKTPTLFFVYIHKFY